MFLFAIISKEFSDSLKLLIIGLPEILLLATNSNSSEARQLHMTEKALYAIIKQKMNVARSFLDDIKTKQLQWYGHVQRMEEGRLPQDAVKWSPPGRRNEVDLNLPGRKGLED
jgi:hypothetical protein